MIGIVGPVSMATVSKPSGELNTNKAIHDAIIAEGDEAGARERTRAALLAQGFTEEECESLYGPRENPIQTIPEKPIQTDEEMLASILKAHPGLTREEALEHLRVYGWDLEPGNKDKE